MLVFNGRHNSCWDFMQITDRFGRASIAVYHGALHICIAMRLHVTGSRTGQVKVIVAAKLPDDLRGF